MTADKLDCHARVRPPGPDDTPPPPTVPVRNHDLVKYRARLVGYEAMSAHASGKPPTFEDWCHGVNAMADYLRTWDRRRTALDEVL